MPPDATPTTADPPALAVAPTGRLSYAGREADAGPKGAALLALLLKRPAVTLAAAKAKVWGRPAAADDPVRGVVYRLNAKLLDIGCPARVGIDRGRVRLTWPPAPPARAG